MNSTSADDLLTLLNPVPNAIRKIQASLHSFPEPAKAMQCILILQAFFDKLEAIESPVPCDMINRVTLLNFSDRVRLEMLTPSNTHGLPDEIVKRVDELLNPVNENEDPRKTLTEVAAALRNTPDTNNYVNWIRNMIERIVQYSQMPATPVVTYSPQYPQISPTSSSKRRRVVAFQ